MKEKQKKEIRQQVVIGIFQWIGYVVLGIIIICLILSPFIITYQAGKNNGITEGWQAGNDNIHKLFIDFKTIHIINSEGESVEIEKYHSCYDNIWGEITFDDPIMITDDVLGGYSE